MIRLENVLLALLDSIKIKRAYVNLSIQIVEIITLPTEHARAVMMAFLSLRIHVCLKAMSMRLLAFIKNLQIATNLEMTENAINVRQVSISMKRKFVKKFLTPVLTLILKLANVLDVTLVMDSTLRNNVLLMQKEALTQAAINSTKVNALDALMVTTLILIKSARLSLRLAKILIKLIRSVIDAILDSSSIPKITAFKLHQLQLTQAAQNSKKEFV